MRAFRRQPRRRVAPPVGGEALAQRVLHRQGGLLLQHRGDLAGQGAAGGREGPGGAALQRRVQPGDQGAAGGGHGHAVPGHGILQRGDPGRVAPGFGEQPVAPGHGGLIARDLARMAGLQRPDQAVEEAAAAGGAFLEEPVHLRRQPDRGDQCAEFGLGAHRPIVQA